MRVYVCSGDATPISGMRPSSGTSTHQDAPALETVTACNVAMQDMLAEY